MKQKLSLDKPYFERLIIFDLLIKLYDYLQSNPDLAGQLTINPDMEEKLRYREWIEEVLQDGLANFDIEDRKTFERILNQGIEMRIEPYEGIPLWVMWNVPFTTYYYFPEEIAYIYLYCYFCIHPWWADKGDFKRFILLQLKFEELLKFKNDPDGFIQFIQVQYKSQMAQMIRKAMGIQEEV